MRSLIIEIARPGSTNNYVLNKDTKYLSMCGANPEVTFSIDCDQYEFIKMINGLRYDDADPDSSSGAISFFQNLATKLFDDLKYLKMQPGDAEPLHVRLTTTPFELAQLPFEFVLTPANISGQSKIPLLANPERIITLTREIRQETDVKYVWPFKPRILFAWSEPNKEMTVPHEEHMTVLKTLVKSFAKPFPDRPDPEPDTTEFLTELPNASLDSIRRELQQAIGGAKPYTHVHILAHGGTAEVFGVQEFRIILCKDGTTDVVQKAKGESLAKAIVSEDPKNNPAVVSLAVCDSGQAGNTILPTGSLVYQLHLFGIPCVFASQFPLTQPGSVKLVEVLFHELIHACDPRLALYKARLELKKESTHDWASLVAYARFPGDINEQLQAVNLKMHFNSMRITNAWVDHVFKYWDEIDEGKKEPALQDLDSRLTTSINGLVSYLDKADKNKSNLANALLQAEHLGLLASAYKRQAEYLFRLGKVNPGKKLSVEADSLKALENAKQFYDCGRKANPAAHWNSMQYLSLKAITEGTLTGDEGLWHVVKYMAQSDEENSGNQFDKIWAWGTLAELYLLKPLTKPGGMLKEEIELSIPVAKDYLKKMAATDSKYNSAKESTARQFERYISWWPDLAGLRFPMWLKDTAKDARDVLPSLAELSEVN